MNAILHYTVAHVFLEGILLWIQGIDPKWSMNHSIGQILPQLS